MNRPLKWSYERLYISKSTYENVYKKLVENV